MVAAVPLLFIFIAVSVNLIQDIAGLMCYECNSLFHNDCANIKQGDRFSPHLQLCLADYSPEDNVTEYRKPLCRKIYQKIRPRQNLELVKRSCGYVLYKNMEEEVCYDVRDEDHEEIVCQCFEDGCNSAWSTLKNFSPINLVLCVIVSSTYALNVR